MGKLKAKLNAFRFKGIIAIVLVFALIASVLWVELAGVKFNYAQKTLELLPKDIIVTKAQACVSLDINTLLLYNSEDEASALAYEQFEVILSDMKIGVKNVDLSCDKTPQVDGYSLVIILLSDLSFVGDSIVDICNWVYSGGNVLLPLTISENAYSSAIENKLGIVASFGYSCAEKIFISDGFMLGGNKAYEVTDAYDSARTVQLNPKTTTVYASINDENGVPLIWESRYGNGKFVVDNFGFIDKAYRGFYAASISLFGDACVYPVINGSTFYLDDFPSQIPEGSNEYISRDFNTTVRDFYINIWWPDMMNVADKHGLKYTGLAIECYDDTVDGIISSDPDTGTFLNFGNMLLRKGGELGYHGYNHQPLCFGNCDYKGIYEYKTWQNEAAMVNTFGHLVDFCDELFPDTNMSIYVPPSNLLSKEGRQVLTNNFSQIKTFSGIYFPDANLDFALVQEFDVDENGIVDQPRIISGCDVDGYMTIAALSELNMHYVNNHFTHPDDALDPDRGAELGWKELIKRFDQFLTWLYDSAPNLRNFRGSELSAAVERFVAVTPHIKTNDNFMEISIENFYDEAQFMIRFNQKQPNEVKGGALTHLTGDLYILEATNDIVTISFK